MLSYPKLSNTSYKHKINPKTIAKTILYSNQPRGHDLTTMTMSQKEVATLLPQKICLPPQKNMGCLILAILSAPYTHRYEYGIQL